MLAYRRLARAAAPERGGRPPRTLVACSGGADSTALLLALGTATRGLVVAHVVHDLRPRDEALADRDHVRALAGGLGLAFVERAIAVTGGAACAGGGGNAEGRARVLRYEALEGLAREQGCEIIVTGHHADDQFESLLMSLIRGSGLSGLRGIAPRRRLAPGLHLVRPMLGVTRAEAESLCRDAKVEWRTDRTNLEGEGLRALLRRGPLAAIEALRPGASARAASAAGMIRAVHALIRDRARSVFGESLEWPRARLRAEPAIVLGMGLRLAARRLTRGRHADRLGRKQVGPAIRAIRDRSTDPRRFVWAGGLRLEVTARAVSLSVES